MLEFRIWNLEFGIWKYSFVIPENFGAIAEKFIWNPEVNALIVKLSTRKLKNTPCLFVAFLKHNT